MNSMKKNGIKSSGIDRIFDILVYCIAIFAFLIVLIPLMNVISSSFSSGKMVQTGQIRIFPKSLRWMPIRWFLVIGTYGSVIEIQYFILL